ncbi:carbohydrate sulfotransferase 10 isoform 4-T4 [Dugong dugon]
MKNPHHQGHAQASAGRLPEWLTSDNMHHQWLLLAACFWVIFMFMVASKFITLTFKDPDGGESLVSVLEVAGDNSGIHGAPGLALPFENWGSSPEPQSGGRCVFSSAYSAKQEFLFLTTTPDESKLSEEKHFPEEMKPTGKTPSDSRLVQPLVYMERLALIRNVCRDEALRNLSHTSISKFVLDRIFVCDKHKILFCQTPKVGNTQWKKVLIVLNDWKPTSSFLLYEIPLKDSFLRSRISSFTTRALSLGTDMRSLPASSGNTGGIERRPGGSSLKILCVTWAIQTTDGWIFSLGTTSSTG